MFFNLRKKKQFRSSNYIKLKFNKIESKVILYYSVKPLFEKFQNPMSNYIKTAQEFTINFRVNFFSNFFLAFILLYSKQMKIFRKFMKETSTTFTSVFNLVF